MAPSAADDDEILRELVARSARRDPPVPQFRSLAGARQYRTLYALVRREIPAGARVLDWGTGVGHFSYFLARAGYRATGYSIEGVSEAAWLGEPFERWVTGSKQDPVHLPFADGEFDAAASIGVLEHVRETGGDERASLAELARVLRPGGTFVCAHFPNRTSWIDWMAARAGKHHHEFRYTRGDIERLTRESGLRLAGAGRYGLLPRNSAHALLGPLANTVAGANAWDALDATLGALLRPLSQNWWFVARKPR
jgi:SAM-dependent methyltransferase